MGTYPGPLLDHTTIKGFFHCGNNLQKHCRVHKSCCQEKSLPSAQLPQPRPNVNFYVLLLPTNHLVSNGKHHRL